VPATRSSSSRAISALFSSRTPTPSGRPTSSRAGSPWTAWIRRSMASSFCLGWEPPWTPPNQRGRRIGYWARSVACRGSSAGRRARWRPSRPGAADDFSVVLSVRRRPPSWAAAPGPRDQLCTVSCAADVFSCAALAVISNGSVVEQHTATSVIASSAVALSLAEGPTVEVLACRDLLDRTSGQFGELLHRPTERHDCGDGMVLRNVEQGP
jgi:hypothetical protein